MNNARLQQLLGFLETAPEDAFTLYSIAYEYLRTDQKEQAIQYFERLYASHPDYIGLYYHYGKTLETQNQTEKAILLYKKGIKEAERQRDTHAAAELRSALNQATGLDDDDF